MVMISTGQMRLVAFDAKYQAAGIKEAMFIRGTSYHGHATRSLDDDDTGTGLLCDGK